MFRRQKTEYHFWATVHRRKGKEIHIQGVLLPDRQTLRGDSRHEDKHC